MPTDPATQPPGTVDSTLHYFMIIQGLFTDASMLLKKTLRLSQHHIKTISKLLQDLLGVLQY